MEQVVMVSVDASNQGNEALHVLNYYIEKIHRPGNKVVVLYCIDISESSLPKSKDGTISPSPISNLWKEEEEKVNMLEEKLGAVFKEKQIPGVLRTVTGKPGEMVVQLAKDEKASMIVVGSRCTGLVRKGVLGTVTDYLVNHASSPVMVCRSTSQHMHDGSRSRQLSGESISAFADKVRQRFSSGGKSKSQSSSIEKEDAKAGKKKENKDPPAA